jgi:hypothetical protein
MPPKGRVSKDAAPSGVSAASQLTAEDIALAEQVAKISAAQKAAKLAPEGDTETAEMLNLISLIKPVGAMGWGRRWRNLTMLWEQTMLASRSRAVTP